MVGADTAKSVPSSPILRPLGSGHYVDVLKRLLVRGREKDHFLSVSCVCVMWSIMGRHAAVRRYLPKFS